MKRPFKELLSDYINGVLPPEELEAFFAQLPDNRALLSDAIDERAGIATDERAGVDDRAAISQSLPDNADRTERMLQRLSAELDNMEDGAVRPTVVHRMHFIRRWGWAAALVLLLAGVAYFRMVSPTKENASQVASAKSADIAPGRNGAILTLSNGTQVVLDGLGNGVVAKQAGANVVLQDGRLAYDATREKTADMVYNIMTTPRGRQFGLTLPDGTKVWLNAASSIRYPTVFAGSERKVEITGEAYFEIAKNVKMPFRVAVDGRADIEVLGTQFDVNAYENEAALNTTLLEGSVRVVAGGQMGKSLVLRPGQQAQMNGELKVINDVDVDKVMAWKNGAFNFEDMDLEEAMRQLERWYDIKVRYEHGVPDVRFGGKIGRDVSLADVLQMLAGTKLKFRMEHDHELVILN